MSMDFSNGLQEGAEVLQGMHRSVLFSLFVVKNSKAILKDKRQKKKKGSNRIINRDRVGRR